MQHTLELFLFMCSLSTVSSDHVTFFLRFKTTLRIVWVIVMDIDTKGLSKRLKASTKMQSC